MKCILILLVFLYCCVFIMMKNDHDKVTWKNPTIIVDIIDTTRYKITCRVNIPNGLAEKPDFIYLRTYDENQYTGIKFKADTKHAQDSNSCTNEIDITNPYNPDKKSVTYSEGKMLSPVNRMSAKCNMDAYGGEAITLTVTVTHVMESDLIEWLCVMRPANSKTILTTANTELQIYRLNEPSRNLTGNNQDLAPSIRETFTRATLHMLSNPGEDEFTLACRVSNFRWSKVTNASLFWSSVYITESTIDGDHLLSTENIEDRILMQSDFSGRIAPKISGLSRNQITFSYQDCEPTLNLDLKRSEEIENCGDAGLQLEGGKQIYGKTVCFPSGISILDTGIRRNEKNFDYRLAMLGVRGQNPNLSPYLRPNMDYNTARKIETGSATRVKASWPTCWEKIWVIGHIPDMFPYVPTKAADSALVTETGQHQLPLVGNNDPDLWTSFGTVNLRGVSLVMMHLPHIDKLEGPIDMNSWFSWMNYDKHEHNMFDVAYVINHREKKYACATEYSHALPNGRTVLIDKYMIQSLYSLMPRLSIHYDEFSFKIAKKEKLQEYDTYVYNCRNSQTDNPPESEAMAIVYQSNAACEIVLPDDECRIKHDSIPCGDKGTVDDGWCGEKNHKWRTQWRVYETTVGRLKKRPFTLRKKTRLDGTRFDESVSCASPRYICLAGGMSEKAKRRFMWLDYRPKRRDSNQIYKHYIQYNLAVQGAIRTTDCPQYEDRTGTFSKVKNDYHLPFSVRCDTAGKFSIELVTTNAWPYHQPVGTVRSLSDLLPLLKYHNPYHGYFHSKKPGGMLLNGEKKGDLMYPDRLEKHDYNIGEMMYSARDALKVECNRVEQNYCTVEHGDILYATSASEAFTWNWHCPCVDTMAICKRTSTEDAEKTVATARFSWFTLTGSFEGERSLNPALRCSAFGVLGYRINLFDMMMRKVCRSSEKETPLALNHRGRQRLVDIMPKMFAKFGFYAAGHNKDIESIISLQCFGLKKNCVFRQEAFFVLEKNWEEDNSRVTGIKTRMYTVFIKNKIDDTLKICEITKRFKSKTSIYESYRPDQYFTSLLFGLEADKCKDYANTSVAMPRVTGQDIYLPFSVNVQHSVIANAEQSWCAYPGLNMVGQLATRKYVLRSIHDSCRRDRYHMVMKRDASGKYIHCSLLETHTRKIFCHMPNLKLKIGDKNVLCETHNSITRAIYMQEKKSDSSPLANWCFRTFTSLVIVQKLTKEVMDKPVKCMFYVPDNPVLSGVGFEVSNENPGSNRVNEKVGRVEKDQCKIWNPKLDGMVIESEESMAFVNGKVHSDGIAVQCNLPREFYQDGYKPCTGRTIPMEEIRKLVDSTPIHIVAETNFGNNPNLPTVIIRVATIVSYGTKTLCKLNEEYFGKQHDGILCHNGLYMETKYMDSRNKIFRVEISDLTSKNYFFKDNTKFKVSFQCRMGNDFTRPNATSKLLSFGHLNKYNERIKGIIQHEADMKGVKEEMLENAIKANRGDTAEYSNPEIYKPNPKGGEEYDITDPLHRAAGTGKGEIPKSAGKKYVQLATDNTRNMIISSVLIGLGVLIIISVVVSVRTIIIKKKHQEKRKEREENREDTK